MAIVSSIFAFAGKRISSAKNLGGHSSRDFPAETLEILNALGRDYNLNYFKG